MVPKVNHEITLPRAAGETFSNAGASEEVADESMDVEVEDVEVEGVVEDVKESVEEPAGVVSEEAAEGLSNAGWKFMSPEGS